MSPSWLLAEGGWEGWVSSELPSVVGGGPSTRAQPGSYYLTHALSGHRQLSLTHGGLSFPSQHQGKDPFAL